jgi:1-deoxy-D-xylulose-5-phosphate reductoisomerase
VYDIIDMEHSTKQIAILGSTGSIGQQTMEVIRSFPDKFRVVALAAGDNLELLGRQIAEFKPKFVYYLNQKARLPDSGWEFMAMEDIVRQPQVEMVVIATPGKAGLKPTLSALKAGKKVALANKESLVMAGEIVTAEARRSSAAILPVDSEHSAIWQCLHGEPQKPACIILTASGGPFLHQSAEQLQKVTVKEALNHPSWKMGRKVTVDSATLMNKGLEVIEAHWLFGVPIDNIKIVIHPQSIIHSMVEFADGTVKAQLSSPDMRLPIQYALSCPERLSNPRLPRLDWDKITGLNFAQPDYERFPCLKLAIQAGKSGGTYPAVLCAADEVAVELFLEEHLKFSEIPHLIEMTLEQHRPISSPALEEVLIADEWARVKALQIAGGLRA